jgi:hypothetical protein
MNVKLTKEAVNAVVSIHQEIIDAHVKVGINWRPMVNTAQVQLKAFFVLGGNSISHSLVFVSHWKCWFSWSPAKTQGGVGGALEVKGRANSKRYSYDSEAGQKSNPEPHRPRWEATGLSVSLVYCFSSNYLQIRIDIVFNHTMSGLQNYPEQE